MATSQPPNHWHSESFLGATFFKQQQEVVLEIGSDRWTRQEMVSELGVGNMAAGRRLSNLIVNELGKHVANLRTLVHEVAFDDVLKIEGIGVTCVYVLLNAMEAKGINVAKWVGEMDVTLHSEQMRARKAAMAGKERKRGTTKRGERKVARKRDTGIKPSKREIAARAEAAEMNA